MDTASPWSTLLSFSKTYKKLVYRGSLYSLINKICDIAPEILIGVAVDVVVKRENSMLAHLGLKDPWMQMVALAILTFLIWVGESSFEYLYQLDWRRLAQNVQNDMRVKGYEHVQKLPLPFFSRQSIGSVTSSLNDDVNQLERFLDGGANALIQVAASVIIIGGVFFVLAPKIALVAMLPMPIIVWGAYIYKKVAAGRYAAVRTQAATLSGILQRNLSGILTIKAMGTEAIETRHIANASQDYVNVNDQAIKVSSAFTPLIRMGVLTGFLGTLVLGGYECLHGEIEVGSFSVLVFLTQRMLWPLTRLAETLDLYQRARASLGRIINLFNEPTENLTRGTSLDLKTVDGALQFNSVSFAYHPGEPVLKELSFAVPSGKKLAIVGATGSGKSTVAKLLLRLYEFEHGDITLDGASIKSYRAQDVRKAFGFVGQDMFLFRGTVRDNIAYGTNQLDEAAMIAAAKAAHAHSFIEALPQGYDTDIGEQGSLLSGGQKQRLVLARIVLRSPRIFILDEATSAVDNESEVAIYSALRDVTKGKTTVMIAHRLSSIRHCDEIVVMDHGRIVERGSHDQLLKKHAHYWRLWQVQTGEHALL